MIAGENDSKAAGAGDVFDKLQVQLSVENGARSIVVVEAALCGDRD